MRVRGIGDIKRTRNISALRSRAGKQSSLAENKKRISDQFDSAKNTLLRKIEQIEQQKALIEKNLSEITRVMQGEIARIDELTKERQEAPEETENAEAKAEEVKKTSEAEREKPPETETEEEKKPAEMAEEKPPEETVEEQKPETKEESEQPVAAREEKKEEAEKEQLEMKNTKEEEKSESAEEQTKEEEEKQAKVTEAKEAKEEEKQPGETTEEQPELRKVEKEQPPVAAAEEKQPEMAEKEQSAPAEEKTKEEEKQPEEAVMEERSDAAEENEQKKKIEVDLGLGKFSFSNVFQGIGSFIDLVSNMVEEKEEKREGEFTSPSGRVKAVYGFSVQKGLSGKPSIEPFGNVKRTARGPVVEEERQPLVDVFDEKDHVLVIVELPGVDGRHIHTEVKGDVLILSAVSGERKYASEIVLPKDVNASTLTSKYKNGILEVRMSKE